jgi:putative transposase
MGGTVADSNMQEKMGWLDGYFVTPDDRHHGREHHILANRQYIYEQARRSHPNRWSRHIRNWNPVRLVWLNPAKEHATQEHSFKEAA